MITHPSLIHVQHLKRVPENDYFKWLAFCDRSIAIMCSCPRKLLFKFPHNSNEYYMKFHRAFLSVSDGAVLMTFIA